MSKLPADGPRETVRHAIAHAAHLLPAQAPIARFVHHNTLHAFEAMPFERALSEAHRLLGGEPYLDEAHYERALSEGRIREDDLDAVLRERVPDDTPRGPLPGARTLRRLRLRAPVPRASGEAVAWLLSETDLSTRLRGEVSDDARARLLGEDCAEARLLAALWQRCLALSSGVEPVVVSAGVRLRDRVLAHTGQDVDTIVSPFLIRFLAGYLDQGIAYWPMPDRDGLYATFTRLYRSARVLPPWLDGLRDELAAGRHAMSQILHELAARGIEGAAIEPFVHAALSALPGWAGMVRELELRPDRAPVRAPPLDLEDYLAVRLLLDRLGAVHVAREAGLDVPRLLAELSRPMPLVTDPRTLALELFVMAQRAGLGPGALADDEVARAFAAEVRAFGDFERRTVYQLAYERRFRVSTLDAIAARARARIEDPAAPIAQLVTCIDERAESFRRHVEEVDPRIATYGYAGHFDVVMSFVAHGAPRAAPLCPPVVTPRHRVREVPLTDGSLEREHALGVVRHEHRVASRTLVRGGFVALTGVASAVPLVARTLWPGLVERVKSASRERLTPAAATRLALDREDGAGPAADGLYEGFTKDEQAAIVETVLRSIGLTRGLAPLVVVAGHGSSSVNNPHASAYECGACGGGKGGPNARAFAMMANDAAVRARLVARGMEIPDETVFVAAYHDTATDAVECYDVDALPEDAARRLSEVRSALARAGARDALERCRRFPDAPLSMSAERALLCAVHRTVDLAQPRPEYCHATNALCVVGRRSLSRGLFLDRRAFLVSYDPEGDDDGRVLERVLAQVVPVCAGINLEYYFSRVDPRRYGSGTKLPHNVTGLIGVMDGHGSDLRTGLHWQTVELHEPMRLLLVVEAPPERLLAVVDRSDEAVRRLIQNRWVIASAVHPETAEVFVLEEEGLRPHTVSRDRAVPTVPSSTAHTRGRREHLPFALVEDGR